jgi:Flp pilus assembly protein TadD
MKDKDLVLQVLSMFSSSAQRDAEIRNMAAVFEELQKEILPALRRTQIVANTDIQGKTNEELVAAVNADLAALNVEEMLFAATLFEDNAIKADIYKTAADRFNDARAWNNLGQAYAVDGNWADAQTALDKAAALSTDPAIANNLAVAALATNNTEKAAQYLPAAGASARGLADVSEGKYAEAASELQGYNKAVAEVLNGNLNAAKNAIVGDESARADYLRGVIAVREGDNAAALTAVRAAIEKDAALKDKAKGDANLVPIAAQI